MARSRLKGDGSGVRPTVVSTTVTDGRAPRGAVRRLASSGFWAVMDQGLFAGSNFVLNVLLARWLGPSEYGVFGVAFAVFLFLSTAHTAVVTEPLLVFGSGRYRARLRSYVGAVLRGHWQLMLRATIGFAPIVLAVGLWFDRTLGLALAALLVVAPVVLLQWLLRRTCYVTMQPRVAATAGAPYLAVTIAAAFVMRELGWLSAAGGMLVMGVASAVSSLVIMHHVHRLVDEQPERRSGARLAGDLWREHWAYGRWGVAGVALAWAGVEVYYVFLSILHGYAAVGSLRAAMNLVVPAMQGFLALSTVALPVFASAARAGGIRRAIGRAYRGFVALALLFWLVLLVATEPLVALLYGDTYLGIVTVVRIVAAVPLAVAVTRVSASALHALERPREIFSGYVPGALVACTIGLATTWWAGVAGAGAGVLLANMGVALAMSRRLRSHLRDTGSPDADANGHTPPA